MNTPLISIITVVYNALSTLEATIQSVLDQEGVLFEYWIIDGGSTDGSVNIIRKYENQLSGWISEPDKGIYDAMNKGINKVKGEWVIFLGSDDTLQPNVLEAISHVLLPMYDIVFGDVALSSGKVFNSRLNIMTLFSNTLHHQGAFYNRRLFENFRYNTDLKIMADYELNLLAYLSKVKTHNVHIVIATAFVGGVSSRFWQPLHEIINIHDKQFKNKLFNKTINMLVTFYYYLVVCKLIFKKYILRKDIPVDLNI